MIMKNKPLLLKPTGKNYIWGGNRLNSDFSKNIDMKPLAETWECSTHPDGPSIVCNGEYDGMQLREVLKRNPGYLGKYANEQGEIPILVKLIDADRDLSVQVHPDDAYAYEHEKGQLGKTEMWYVLDAKSEARLVYGFRKDVDEATVRKAIAEEKLTNYLQQVNVAKDDVFFIESGIVHAIGSGILVAEVQENSNITYRLFDYNRVDKNGNKRELHIDKAMKVVNFKSSAEPRQPMRVLRYSPGVANELLCRCKYFEVHRMIINSERRQKVEYQSLEDSFRVLLCVQGCGVIKYDNESLDIYRGDCIFIPADSSVMQIHGKMTFLEILG